MGAVPQLKSAPTSYEEQGGIEKLEMTLRYCTIPANILKTSL